MFTLRRKALNPRKERISVQIWRKLLPHFWICIYKNCFLFLRNPHWAQNISVLENGEEKAIRFSFDKYSHLQLVSVLYGQIGLLTLQHRRKVEKFKFMFNLRVSSGYINAFKDSRFTPLWVLQYPFRYRNENIFIKYKFLDTSQEQSTNGTCYLRKCFPFVIPEYLLIA